MGLLDLVSLVASIVSLVLAVLAIWLSFAFFKMSSKLSDSTTQAAKEIQAGVGRLEKLFDTLYSDTFSMMRDTVTDMRNHLWRESPGEAQLTDEAAEEAERRARQLKEDLSEETAGILRTLKIADQKMDALGAQLHEVIGRAISGSRQVEVEAQKHARRSLILKIISEGGGKATLRQVLNAMSDRYSISYAMVVSALKVMNEAHLVEFRDGVFTLDSDICLTQQGRAEMR